MEDMPSLYRLGTEPSRCPHRAHLLARSPQPSVQNGGVPVEKQEWNSARKGVGDRREKGKAFLRAGSKHTPGPNVLPETQHGEKAW